MSNQVCLFNEDNRIIDRSNAVFSECRKYRYALWRIWDETKPIVMFIGLNPSTANETENDPTIKRVKAIAESNGFGGFCMMNCWPYIATNPTELKIDAISSDKNNLMLTTIAAKCEAVVFAWGNFDIVRKTGRDRELQQMFPNAKALHINKNGSPKHPLYCPKSSVLIPFQKKQS
ncbi:MAG TPA: DUF1643 domain-containing protein [Chitinophagaceae bacterium]|nr:DUF1643 domain-containing protein [Chitinophagaceae bacterium]